MMGIRLINPRMNPSIVRSLSRLSIRRRQEMISSSFALVSAGSLTVFMRKTGEQAECIADGFIIAEVSLLVLMSTLDGFMLGCTVRSMHPALLPPTVYFWLIPLLLVDLVLRGMALWSSAQRRQFTWFIVLLILNSAGILPLGYLLIYGLKTKTTK